MNWIFLCANNSADWLSNSERLLTILFDIVMWYIFITLMKSVLHRQLAVVWIKVCLLVPDHWIADAACFFAGLLPDFWQCLEITELNELKFVFNSWYWYWPQTMQSAYERICSEPWYCYFNWADCFQHNKIASCK